MLLPLIKSLTTKELSVNQQMKFIQYNLIVPDNGQDTQIKRR